MLHLQQSPLPEEADQTEPFANEATAGRRPDRSFRPGRADSPAADLEEGEGLDEVVAALRADADAARPPQTQSPGAANQAAADLACAAALHSLPRQQGAAAVTLQREVHEAQAALQVTATLAPHVTGWASPLPDASSTHRQHQAQPDFEI